MKTKRYSVFLDDIDLSVPDDGFTSDKKYNSISDYLKELEQMGSASSRYAQVAMHYSRTDLIVLDRIVHQIQTQIVRSQKLEDRIRALGDQMINYLMDQNLTYDSTSIPTQLYHTRVTVLERVLKGCYKNKTLYEEWVKTNIKIRKKDIEFLKQA